VIKALITSSIFEPLGIQTPLWIESEHLDLAECMAPASPDRFLGSSKEGSLQINISSSTTQGRRMLSEMVVHACVHEGFARTNVTTLAYDPAGGAFGNVPPTLHQLFESINQIWGTDHYLHYLDLFGIDALVGKHFYNFRSSEFRHPTWMNVDYKSAHFLVNHIDIH
jgi:hypothetical protein